MKVTLLSYTPDPEQLVAAAAKLCYSSSVDIATLMDDLTSEKTERFLNKLMDLGHLSPVEHVSFTFAIEGVSRAFLAQITRHRVGVSFSVRSQRYVSEENFGTVAPKAIEANDEARVVYSSTIADIKNAYKKLKDIGLKNEDARAILPNACETRMIVTMNARELMHYFNERCCRRAQAEHRAVANEMLRICKHVAPILFKNAGPKCVKGYCPEGSMSCGKAPTLDKLLNFWKKSASERKGEHYAKGFERLEGPQ